MEIFGEAKMMACQKIKICNKLTLITTVAIVILIIMQTASASLTNAPPAIPIQTLTSSNNSSIQTLDTGARLWSEVLKISVNDFRSFSSIVRAHLNEKYHRFIENPDYAISYELGQMKWLEKILPESRLIYAYPMFMMPPPTGMFVFMKGKTYIMPNDFNEFVSDADFHISDEASALEIANLYVQGYENGSGNGSVILLSSAEDIPTGGKPLPRSVAELVIPPSVTRNDENFILRFDTWTDAGGKVRGWQMSIDLHGKVVAFDTLIAKRVGEFLFEGANTEGADEIGVLQGFNCSEDVIINGVCRFTIYWNHEDFPSPERENVVIGYIDAAARTAWTTIIDTWNFNHPTYSGPTKIELSPEYQPGGSGSVIQLPNDLENFAASFSIYYPTELDLYKAVISHEFFHKVQDNYLHFLDISISWWLWEGTAKFIESVIVPASFWQNSYLAGLPGGPYNQSDNHKSAYIWYATWYIQSPENSLYEDDPPINRYRSALYWRYIYEHHGGIGRIREIFDRLLADNPGPEMNYDINNCIASINSALGATDLFFSDFSVANYLEFSPYPFARDNEFYQYSDRYYENVPTESMTFAGSEIIDNGTVNPWVTDYVTINPTTSDPLRIHFDGNDASDFFVKVFLIKSGNIYTQTIELNNAQDGDYQIGQANYYDNIALAVIRLWDSGTGGYTVRLTPEYYYPVAYWPFDEGWGATARDGSGYGNDGTIYGAQWVDGRLENALRFDGSDDYVRRDNGVTGIGGTNQMTVMAWVNRSAISTESPTIVHVGNLIGWQTCAMWFFFNDYNELRVGFGGNGHYKYAMSVTKYTDTNVWHHVAGTYNAGVVKLYVDGSEISVTIIDGGLTGDLNQPNSYLRIGNIYSPDPRKPPNRYYFPGLIDEIYIYNRALSESEIMSHHQAGGLSAGTEQTTFLWIENIGAETKSRVHDAGGAVSWNRIEWDATASLSDILVEVRVADENMEWSRWRAVGNGERLAQVARYLQCRATRMGAENVAPVPCQIYIHFSPLPEVHMPQVTDTPAENVLQPIHGSENRLLWSDNKL